MPRRVLLDTGVVVALVNAADPDHARCVEVWKEIRASLVTVEGVLVETAHLLRRVPGAVDAAINLVVRVGARLVPPTEARLLRAATLMKTYRDVPMDLVDALLVAAAEELETTEILTLDRRGFGAYRAAGRRAFTISP
jgi:predicted nucleic acid-binding protein